MKPVREILALLALLSLFSGTGFLPAQSTQPGQSANGVILGSWNTHVDFDDVRIVSGDRVVLNETFDARRDEWRPEHGLWEVSGGICRQTGDARPAHMSYAFADGAASYTITLKARKKSGAEGFLVGFGMKDSENYYWLNLGGWNNTGSGLEKTLYGNRKPIGPRVDVKIDPDRWYEIRIQVEGQRIRCDLDGQKIIEVNDPGFGNAPSGPLPADYAKRTFGHALIPDLAADPSIVEIDGTFYCYATTDGWGQHLSTSGTPVVWTSRDFLNWSFEGSSFPPDFDLKYWAPSTVVHREGRYYSYPTLDGHITVVSAEKPTGPFRSPDGTPITKAYHPQFPIRPNTIDAEVFIDDDGQAYMVWQQRHMVKLKPDLLSPDGNTITVPTKRQGYSEGPFLLKRGGIYYYLYTLGGAENYQYAYMMSRTSPTGPWEAPVQDIIATTDRDQKVFGPGHGSFFRPKDSDQWYFVYLEFGRGSTNRQVYADKMNFNPDGTIQPIKLTKTGVGALRNRSDESPNLALEVRASASSTRPNQRIRPEGDPSLDRVEPFSPANALDGANGTRWLAAAGDLAPWFQVDLGAPRDIRRTEAYFVKPAAGHAYRLEWSLDGSQWQPYGGHDELTLRSPHRDDKPVRTRYLKLTILKGEPGLWEFRVYGRPN